MENPILCVQFTTIIELLIFKSNFTEFSIGTIDIFQSMGIQAYNTLTLVDCICLDFVERTVEAVISGYLAPVQYQAYPWN